MEYFNSEEVRKKQCTNNEIFQMMESSGVLKNLNAEEYVKLDRAIKGNIRRTNKKYGSTQNAKKLTS